MPKKGDKVWHAKHGTGVVIGTDQIIRVFFEEGIVIGFYAARVANEDRLISELMPVSDWVEIDWDGESTLPDLDKEYLACLHSGHIVILKFTVDEDTGYAVFVDDDDNYFDVTHWQPLPQPPK